MVAGPEGMQADEARRRRGATSYLSGLSAEEVVERWYTRAGAVMADRRWRGKGGELDLVLRDGVGFVFVEVKKARDFDRAAERVGPRQMQRLMDAAAEYLSKQPDGQLSDVRFDVALVNGTGEVRVLENAFGHF